MTQGFSTTNLLHAIREIPKSVLSSSEKYVLIIILSCLNANNETWYSVKSLSEFAGLNFTTFQRHIRKLEEKRFVLIQRPAYYTNDLTNRYSINTNLILSFRVDKSKSVDKPLCNLPTASETAMQIAYQPLCKLPTDRYANCTPKKDSKKETKKERAREKPAPLSEIFLPDQKTRNYAKSEMGYSVEECEVVFSDFMNYHLDDADGKQLTHEQWQKKLRDWFRREKREPGFLSELRTNHQPKSTVKEYEPEEPPKRTANTDAVAKTALADIFTKLGKPNGIGKLINEQDHGRLEKGSGTKTE